MSKVLIGRPLREAGVQTDQGAGVPAGRREGPVRPKEGSKFYGVGVEACGETITGKGALSCIQNVFSLQKYHLLSAEC